MKKIFSFILSLAIICTTAMGTSAKVIMPDDNSFQSESIQMIDKITGDVIYSKNAEQTRSIASITKVMTFVVACENIKNAEKTEITYSQLSQDIFYGEYPSLAGLHVGETVTALDMFYLLLMPSGCDAALELALYYDRTVGCENPNIGYSYYDIDLRAYDLSSSAFVGLMNETAKRIGCENTHFMNPTGLTHANHYSTAADVAKIIQYAFTLPYFQDIVTTTRYTTKPTEYHEEGLETYTTLPYYNDDFYEGRYMYKYADGAKTGTTNDAGKCISTSATKDGTSFIIIGLGAPMSQTEHGSVADSIKLFEWGFDNFKRIKVLDETVNTYTVPVKDAKDMVEVSLIPTTEVEKILPIGTSIDDMTFKTNIPESLTAPLTAGEAYGTIEAYFDDELIGTRELTVSVSVESSIPATTNPESNGNQATKPTESGLDWIGLIFSIIIWIVVIIVVLFIILSIIVNVRKAQRRKKRRQNTRYRKR